MTLVRHNMRRFLLAGGPLVALRLIAQPGLAFWTAWDQPELLPYALGLWALTLLAQGLRLRPERSRWAFAAAPAARLLELGLAMALPLLAGTWQTPWTVDAWIALAIALRQTQGVYRVSALAGWWIYAVSWSALLAGGHPLAGGVPAFFLAAMVILPMVFLLLARPLAPAAAPPPDPQIAGHLQTLLRRFEQIKASLGPARAGHEATALLDATLQASRGIQELRSLLEIVAPPAHSVPTLADRMQGVTRHWQQANAIPVAFSAYPAAPRSLPPMVEALLLRALDETLSNVERHAKASQVEVELRAEDESLQLIVRDNGVGLASGAIQRPGCNGLRMLRYRVQEFNGQMEVYEGVDGGLVVQLAVPLSVYAL